VLEIKFSMVLEVKGAARLELGMRPELEGGSKKLFPTGNLKIRQ
jgi:hypothetical protein